MSFSESLVLDAGSVLCPIIAVQDGFFRRFELLPEDRVINELAAGLRDMANRQFCNREPPPLPPYPPPDNNCPGAYSIRVRFTEKADDGRRRQGENEIAVWGPILSYRYSQFTSEGVPQRFEVFAYGSTNVDRLSSPVYSLLASGVYGNPAAESFVVDILAVIPNPGNPNNCGNPIPNPPDVDPNSDRSTRNITYINNEGDEVSIQTEVSVGFAFNTQNNSIAIPVTYTFSPNYTFAPGYQYNVDVVFTLDGSEPYITPPYSKPPAPGQPGAPAPNGDNPNPYLPPRIPTPPTRNPPATPAPPPTPPDVPEPEDPPKKGVQAIVGAIVTTTEVPLPTPISTLGQADNPDVWFPDLGLVSFLISVEGGPYSWTEDIRVKNKRQFIPCPWRGGAIQVKGTPRAAVQWTITPVYGSVDA